MIILSIDPGIEKVGYSIFELSNKNKNAFDYVTSGLITTDRKLKLECRIHKIYQDIDKIVIKYQPEKLVMEQLFFIKNHKTAISVSQSQGVIMLLGAQHEINVSFLTPLQIKQIITGNGFADKKSVFKMLKLLLSEDCLEVADDDQSDAIACGLAYCYLNKNVIE